MRRKTPSTARQSPGESAPLEFAQEDNARQRRRRAERQEETVETGAVPEFRRQNRRRYERDQKQSHDGDEDDFRRYQHEHRRHKADEEMQQVIFDERLLRLVDVHRASWWIAGALSAPRSFETASLKRSQPIMPPLT